MSGLIRNPGAFVVYVLVSSITPGPNNLMLATIGVTKGPRQALRSAAGVSVGWGMQIAVCGVGLVAIIRAVPWLRSVIEGLAIAYLLWLAWKLWRADHLGEAVPSLGFWGAIGFQWANPKALTMSLTTSGLFVVPSAHGLHGPSVAAVSLAAVALNYPCVSAWGLAGSSMASRLAEPRAIRRFSRACSVVLVALVVWLLVA
ncbi:MAG TPA: LysE family translocator [Acidimicrobiales bacterium]